jgi:transposase
MHYALNQWEYLSAYINHGEVEIDNNWVENQIKPFSLGRKNWLFVGNQKRSGCGSTILQPNPNLYTE